MKEKVLAVLRNKRMVAVSFAVAIVLAVGAFMMPGALKAKASAVVPDGILNVKMQVQKSSDGVNYDMRLVSSVDSLDYKNVGFEVSFDADGDGNLEDGDNGSGVDEVISWTTYTVLERIKAVSENNDEYVTYKYSPKVIDTKSEYFVTGTLRGIDAEKLGNHFYVRAFCTPLDSDVKTYGVGRYFSIEDANSKSIINIPVAMDSLPSGVEVGDTELAVTVADVETKAEVLAYVDGYAQLNVAVPENASVTETKVADKTKLASANKVVVTDNSASAIYRNLESTYANRATSSSAGAGDSTWYTLDTSADAFVIATDADLYGLAQTGTIPESKTVYLVSDITLNSGTVDNWKTNNFVGLINWTPITKFIGTFDGQGHDISGLYHYTGTTGASYAGLFKETTGTISDFSLKNSYLKSEVTIQPGLGSIVGTATGTLRNIYSNAEVVTTNGMWAGGLAGCSSTSGSLNIEKCCYAGTVQMTYTLGGYAIYGGGFVGQAKQTLNLKNCLFNGIINVTYKQPTTNTSASQDFRVGSFVGYTSGALAIENCLSAGQVSAYWEDPVATTATINNVGSLVGATASAPTVSNCYDMVEATKQVEGVATATSVTAAAGNNTIAGTKALRFDDNLFLGLDGCRYLALDFENTWAAVDGGLPQLKAFAENPMDLTGVTSLVDYGWYSEATGEATSPYILSDSKDLYGFTIISTIDNFSGETVKLETDKEFIMNEGTVVEWEEKAYEGLNNWIPVSSSFAGIFDGQGSVISGLYLTKDTRNAGLFGQLLATVTIKNFSMKNSYLVSEVPAASNDARIGSIVGWHQGGTLTLENVYSDAKVETKHSMSAGGLVGYAHTNGDVIMNNCWFNGNVVVNDETGYQPYAGGMIGQAAKSLKMTNCLFTGDLNVTYQGTIVNTAINGFVGGFAGSATAPTVTGCLSAGTVSMVWAKNSNVNYGTTVPTTIGAVAGLFGNAAGTFTNSNTYDATSITTQAPDKAAVTVTASQYGSAPTNKTIRLNSNEELWTGLDACRYTTLDFASADGWAAVADDVPRPKYFVTDGAALTEIDSLVDFSWYGAGTATTYTLDSKEDLYGFAIASRNDAFSGKTVQLGDDIILNAGTVASWEENDFAGLDNWVPIGGGYIGTEPVYFAGTFDGNEKTISGLYLNTNTQYVGLFANIKGGCTIQDLSLENSYLVTGASEDTGIGSIVGRAYGGVLQNVYSNATVVTSNGMKAGGMIGYTNATVKLSHCWFAGTVDVNYSGTYGLYAGGLIGDAFASAIYEYCMFSGTVNANYTRAGQELNAYVGGFAGRSYGNFTATGCIGAGTVTVTWKKIEGASIPVGFNRIGSVTGFLQGTPTITDLYDATTTVEVIEGRDTAQETVTDAIVYNSTPSTAPDITPLASKDLLYGDLVASYDSLNDTTYWTPVTGALPIPAGLAWLQ